MKKFAILFLLWASAAFGQVFTTLYLPTQGSGLTLNIAAGRAFCGTSMVTYAGGTLLMTASTTNYVYLNTASSCAVAVKSSTFVLGDIPIAVVVAGSSTITSVGDQRTSFSKLPSVAGATWGSITGSLSSQTDLQTALNAKAGFPGAGIPKSTGSGWTSSAYTDLVALWAGGSCSGFLKSDGTCSLPSIFPYPNAGIPVSTGSAWTTSKVAPTGALVGTSDPQALTNKSINGVTLDNSGSATEFLDRTGNYSVPAGLVTARAFGIICDGTDRTAGFVALHTYLLDHDGSVVVFDPGTGPCVSSNPRFTVGVKNVRFLANGASFKFIQGPNCSATTNDISYITNLDYFRASQDDYPTCTVQQAPNYLINSANAGDTTIAFVTASDSASFNVGDNIWLNGYDQQWSGGYPPNMRYFEICKVAAINHSTGVITLSVPLQNSYDSRWHSFPYWTGASFGPASVMDLNRTGTYAFTLAENIVWEDAIFLATPGGYDDTHFNGYATVYSGGVKNFECDRCTMGSFVAGDGNRATLVDSIDYWFEPDKNIDYAVSDGGTMHGFTDGAGTNHVIIKNLNVVPYPGIGIFSADTANQSMEITNNKIYNYQNGACIGGYAPYMIVTGNDCTTLAGTATNIFVGSSFMEFPFTVLSVPTSLTVTAASLDNSVEDHLKAGAKVQTASGKFCYASIDPYWNGTNITVTFSSCSSTPVIGDVFSIYTTQNLQGFGNSCGKGSPCNPFAGQGSRVAKWNSNTAGDTNMHSVPFEDENGTLQQDGNFTYDTNLHIPGAYYGTALSISGFANLGTGVNLSSLSGIWRKFAGSCDMGDFSQDASAASSLASFNLCSTGHTWQSLASLIPASVSSFTGDGALLSNSASTGSVTATLKTQAANTILAGPPDGADATPTFRFLVSADIPNNAANTTGTAANLSGTPALPNGTTATTQTAGDNSTKLATTAFVTAAVANPPIISQTNYFNDFYDDKLVTATSWGSPSGNFCAVTFTVPAVANVPGILTLASGTVSGAGQRCGNNDYAVPPLNSASNTWNWKEVVDIPVLPATTSAKYFVGFTNFNNVGFLLDPAQASPTHWYCSYNNTSNSPVVTDSGVVATTSWTALSVVQNGTNLVWSIGGTSVCTVSIGSLFSDAKLFEFGAVEAGTTTSVNMLVDYVQFSMAVSRP